jgi:hypothetical protein
MEESKKYTLNREDLTKIAIGACIAMGGGLLAYLAEIIGQIDFGSYTAVAVVIGAVLINAARKFLAGYQDNGDGTDRKD